MKTVDKMLKEFVELYCLPGDRQRAFETLSLIVSAHRDEAKLEGMKEERYGASGESGEAD